MEPRVCSKVKSSVWILDNNIQWNHNLNKALSNKNVVIHFSTNTINQFYIAPMMWKCSYFAITQCYGWG